MLCYAQIGTAQYSPMPDDQPWATIPDGWVLMNYMRPDNRPTRFGDWIAQADGEWNWQQYPDPPFAVAYFEGKLINLDSMQELDPSTLPGQVSARLATAESTLSGIATAMASEVLAAQQARTQAQQYAASAGEAAQGAVASAISALPAPVQFEVVSVTLGAGGASSASFTKAYTAAPIIIPIPRWVGDQQFIAVVGTPTSSGVAVSGKRSRDTLMLTSGPFEPAVVGDVVQFAVIGR